MSGWDKLDIAQDLIQKNLTDQILRAIREIYRPVIHFQIQNGTDLYIRYNDHDEYSYQIIYSQKSLDRIRFDNYDAHWNVKSKPHHVHKRFEAKGSESNMNGNPVHDIPLLLKVLR